MAAAVVKKQEYILAAQPEPQTVQLAIPPFGQPGLSFLLACKNKHLGSAAVGRLQLPALPWVCSSAWQCLSLWKEEVVSGREKCPQFVGLTRS